MHFYITNKNTKNLQLISDALEQNFENIIVGRSTDAQRTFDDLHQLRVDVLVVDYDLAPFDGLALLRRLKQANILPRVVMTANTPSESLITAAYQNGCDFFIHHQLNSEEIAHISKIISTTLQLLSNMRVIGELSGSLNNPYGRQQTTHHQQIDHVTDTLRFLGIASEKGYNDIMKIIRLMVDKDMSFDQIDLEESFGINSREKKVIYQRIRRTLHIGIVNLATMCIDYPDNEILLDYANNLFEYQNIHVEMQHQNGKGLERRQISLQHFFDGLLQESYRVKRDGNNELW
ncbi:response regulator receiver protein [Lactobacillus delbrueckii subsp. jakobsenii ZN7a-9 = DSM 26046]|uniref:DNA-binding domain-containing protein n=1 Tax=Lactobacillus delbrueckii TaxID=1584 RepID=UPI000331017A|nr:DNA-binding domain-containing protein [Lactobacillus delbrueckii]APG72297.1 response regulator receiver protein [Lactobacillus delbrueckii subsp. jakobsenii ZN7a-9 = DSM 26046]APG73818.1 response regulator receiver protein [Lactobacillus delbrueckii subsp. jakobsenii ZN7a-9 = DSM 26046]EOD02776.1 rec (receiver) domain signal transduction protein [Lactobacillus delbrueckii subsp. jakobsenii ZN7a-9 = DSM 26046]KRO16821.1 two component response regulator [Lactobacillus delbrueckii subsp. jakobs